MPVSGNEESKVLARKSSDISTGIPLKKRRFLLVPPPSPPRNESPHALPEVLDIKSNKESSSDLKHKEESGSDGEEKDESWSVPKNNDEYGEDVEHKEAAGSDVQNEVESPPDLKDKEESLSDQGPSSVANKSPGISVACKINLLEIKKEIVFAPADNLSKVEMDASGLKLPEVRPVDELGSANEGESKTELSLLTGKSAASEVLRNTEGAVSVGVKKEMESRQIDDCNLKLSTVSGNDQILVPKEFLVSGFGYQNTQSNDNDGAHPSLLSLSLSKEVPTLEHKIADASHSGGKTICANRSNWDLNTPMDSWEGSTGDAAVQGNVDGSTKKTDSNNGKPSSSSIPLTSVLSEKGKQVISTNEPRSSFPNFSTQLIQNSEDSLRLTLSSFQETEFRRTPSGLSANLTYRRDVLNRQSGFESSINKNKSGFRVVKSEPTDENPKFIPTGTSCSSTELLDFNSLKREHVDKHGTQVLELTASSSHNISAQKGIKSEPTSEVCEAICGTPDLTLQQSIGKFVHPQESGSSSSILTMPVTPPNPSPSRLRTSSELSMSADISNQSERSVHNKEFHFGTDVVIQPDTSPKPVNDGGRDENLAGDKIVNAATEAKNVDDCEMKIVKDHSHDLHVNGEGSVSDEEKINISAEMMEDESCESDYESDGNQAFGSHLGKQKRRLRDDDEYEDGEVREHRLHSMTEDPAANGIDAETSKLVCDNNDCPSGHPGDTDGCQLHDKDNEMKIHDDMTMGHISQNAGIISNENCGQLSDKDGHSQKLSLDGMTATVADERVLCNSYQGKSGDTSGEKSSMEGFDRDIACDGASSGGRIERTTGESKGETVEAVNPGEKPNLSIPTVEASIDGANAAKDSTRGGNRSRIINLPRASATSPSKSRSIPDKLLSSRNGRERYSDLDGDNIFLRGTRDEMDTDAPHRFVRERIQDHSFRNSRLNYTRGRGRFSGRLETSRSEWGSDRDFALGNYSGDYRFTRNKRAAVLADAEIDSDDYVVAPDGAGLSTGRERKSLNDDLPSFRHPSSRKFSPGVRDGPAGRGVDMLRRIPRNISPSRRNDENGIGLVGVRHDGKFLRVLPDDIIDHAYARPHTMYEGGDNQFIRGNRNFSSFQRRGFPRVRSKSPVGSRTRSPGSWPSPRRRSPDGFNVLPHIAQHRSPGMYGTRSPERTCFPEQMVARRRGSPSYMARPPPNDSRDVDSGREHGHPRPINPSRRSPSDRVLNRSTRRLDDLDPRIRMSDDEYFGRPVQSSRFQEFHADASSDDRRKCSERRGFGRPFRPPYMGETDNSRFHSDDGPRPLRFCSNADTEFTGRNIRARDFDGQMKSRGMVARRRIRSIDDQEGSYRHAGRVWHDDAFNEGSGFKRRF